MSASLGGAIKTVVEAAGLGLSAYRDDAGKATTSTKWVTIAEGIVITNESLGDAGASDAVTELVQVDLWQPWRSTGAGGAAEDYDLADQLCRALHGVRLTGAPTTVRSCTVDDVVRLVEREENLVHHAITLRIRRER